MSAESVEPNQLFLTITQQIFNNWTALLIAIRHGDHSVQEKAAWFPGAIFEGASKYLLYMIYVKMNM